MFLLLIEAKTLFIFDFRLLLAFVLIVCVIFVLNLMEYNRKWPRVSKELGQTVQNRGICPNFGCFVWIWAFNRDFFEPLLIFCCNLSSWAQQGLRERSETSASNEIRHKFDVFLSIFIQNVQILGQYPLFLTLLPSSFNTLVYFFLYFIRLSTKMTKTINSYVGKYWNSKRNIVLGLISIQNVPIWAKYCQIRFFHWVLFESLLIYSVSHQGKPKNGWGFQDIHWLLPKFASKQLNCLDFIRNFNSVLFSQIRASNQDFFDPLVFFCCNLSAWVQKWSSERSETLASTFICD